MRLENIMDTYMKDGKTITDNYNKFVKTTDFKKLEDAKKPNMDAFIKKVTFQKITKEGILNLGSSIELMAEAELLQAHKNAVTVRLNELNK